MCKDHARSLAKRFIVGVFKRPRMYTLKGSFEEAYAFLHGYYGGQCSIEPEGEESAVWFDLGEKLRVRFGVATTEAFGRFLQDFASSDEACGAMADYAESSLLPAKSSNPT
jgi:hypothetical protein